MHFLKSIGFFMVISAISYGGYMAYNNWYGSAIKEKTSQTLESLSNNVKGAVTEEVEKYSDIAKTSILDSVGKYAATFVGEALSSIGTTITQAGVSVRGESSKNMSIGENTTPQEIKLDESRLIALSLKVGAPLSFLLPPNMTYTILWGDDTKESGHTPEKETLIIKHAWKAQGVYKTVIESTKNNITEEYNYVISVKN